MNHQEATIDEAMEGCRKNGPMKVVCNQMLQAHILDYAEKRRIPHDFVLVRIDGYTLGVRLRWLEKARELYGKRWIAMFKHCGLSFAGCVSCDATKGYYHRVW